MYSARPVENLNCLLAAKAGPCRSPCTSSGRPASRRRQPSLSAAAEPRCPLPGAVASLAVPRSRRRRPRVAGADAGPGRLPVAVSCASLNGTIVLIAIADPRSRIACLVTRACRARVARMRAAGVTRRPAPSWNLALRRLRNVRPRLGACHESQRVVVADPFF